jgi:hypothetical protein
MSEGARDGLDPGQRSREAERVEQRAKLFLPVKDQVNGFFISEDGEDAPKLVDEIDSMCMNCHEDVGSS